MIFTPSKFILLFADHFPRFSSAILTRVGKHLRPHWIISELVSRLNLRIPIACDLGNGLKITVLLGDFVSDQIRTKGWYEPETVNVLSAQLNRSSVFFDIGANIGQYTLVAAPLCRQVHSFEAIPGTFSILDFNVGQNHLTNVRTSQLAVSDVGGEVEMAEARLGNLGASSMKPRQRTSGNKYLVRATSIDDYCQQTGMSPDVLKIDVEGAELLVLRGAEKSLRQKHPVLLVEFCEQNQRQFGSSNKALEQYLTSHDYKLYRVRDEKLEPYTASTEDREFNVLAL